MISVPIIPVKIVKFTNITIAFAATSSVSVPFIFFGFDLPDPKVLIFSLIVIITNVTYFAFVYIIFKWKFGYKIRPRFENFVALIFLLRVSVDFWVINRSLNGLGDIDSDLGTYYNIFTQISSGELTDLGMYPIGYFYIISSIQNYIPINLATIIKIFDFIFITATPILSLYLVSIFTNRRNAYIYFVLLLIFYPNNAPWKYFIEVTFITILYLLIQNYSKENIQKYEYLMTKRQLLWSLIVISLAIFIYPLPLYLSILLLSLFFSQILTLHNKNWLYIVIALFLFSLLLNSRYIINIFRYTDIYFMEFAFNMLLVLMFLLPLIVIAYKYRKRSWINSMFIFIPAIGILVFFNIGDVNGNYSNLFFDLRSIFPFFPLLIFLILIESFVFFTSSISINVVNRLSNTLMMYSILVLSKIILLLKFFITSDMSLALRMDSLIKYLLLLSLSFSICDLDLKKVFTNRVFFYFAAILLMIFFSFYRSIGFDYFSNLSSIYIYSFK